MPRRPDRLRSPGRRQLLRDEALAILRANSSYGVALENHCLRLAEFALALGELRTVALDEDLIRAGCLLHDIGLCVKDPRRANYLERGYEFVKPHVEEWDLDEEQRRVFSDVMLYNHSLKPVPGISEPAEMVRLGVQVEHSLGRVAHGLDAALCRGVFDRFPRHDFNRVLLSFFKTVMMEDGPLELFRIFLPTGLLAPLERG